MKAVNFTQTELEILRAGFEAEYLLSNKVVWLSDKGIYRERSKQGQQEAKTANQWFLVWKRANKWNIETGFKHGVTPNGL